MTMLSMNSELWKEAVMTYFKALFAHSSGRAEKEPRIIWLKTTGIPTENRTEAFKDNG
jgi:hypothetical protein